MDIHYLKIMKDRIISQTAIYQLWRLPQAKSVQSKQPYILIAGVRNSCMDYSCDQLVLGKLSG